MKKTLIFLVVAGVIFSGPLFRIALEAQETPRNALLILAKHDHVLLIVDPLSLKVIAKVPVGDDPHEVVVSADGKTAYVSNYGFGAYHTLAVVDLLTQKQLPSVDLGALRGPHGLIFSGGKVWFTAEAAKAIGSFDPASKSIDWILGTGQNRTHMIWVSQDSHLIVTTNVSSGTISIVEKTGSTPPQSPLPPGAPRSPDRPMGPPPDPPGGDWNETIVRVGNGSEGFDVSPDGKEIWVANAADGTVSIIDIATKHVTQTLAVDVGGANRLKFTADGKFALISSLRSPDVVVIETATRKTVKHIPVGHGSAGIVMQPDGERAFVACSPDGYVAVIDLHSLQVVGKIEAGREPDGMAWALRP
jgi:YVTN family beta-propeller protein